MIIIILLFFLFANATTVIILNNKFGKCIPITLMLSAFIMLVSGLFKTFIPGYIVNIIYSLIWIIVLLKKKNYKEFKDNFFSNGFYIFISLFVLIIIHNYKRRMIKWDEFSHWGVMLKEMIRHNMLYPEPVSTLMLHKDYPPIIQLYELLFLQFTGGFSESHAISSIHLFELSLMLPFLETKENDKRIISVIKGILVFFIAFFMINFFDGHDVINSIYLDYPMSIIVACIMANIFIEKEYFNKCFIVFIILSLSTLVLTKQMGIPLYLMCLFMLVLSILFKVKDIKKYYKKIISLLLVVLIIPTSLFVSWNIYVKQFDVDEQFNVSDIKVSNLYKIVAKNEGLDYQIEGKKNFVKAVLKDSISTSYLSLTLIPAIIIGLVLLYLIIRKMSDKKNKLLILVTLILGAIGYVFVMFALYMFCFADFETLVVASYNRYMASYVLIIYFVDIMLYLYYYNKLRYFIVLSLVLLGINISPAIYNVLPYKENNKIRSIYRKEANYIKEHTKENDKVYILEFGFKYRHHYFTHYYMSDRYTNSEFFTWDLEENKYDELYKPYLAKYDYIFLVNLNDEFDNLYGYLFDRKVISGDLFKINKDGDNLSFEYIGNRKGE